LPTLGRAPGREGKIHSIGQSMAVNEIKSGGHEGPLLKN
jgi:hypothetical protein